MNEIQFQVKIKPKTNEITQTNIKLVFVSRVGCATA